MDWVPLHSINIDKKMLLPGTNTSLTTQAEQEYAWKETQRNLDPFIPAKLRDLE